VAGGQGITGWLGGVGRGQVTGTTRTTRPLLRVSKRCVSRADPSMNLSGNKGENFSYVMRLNMVIGEQNGFFRTSGEGPQLLVLGEVAAGRYRTTSRRCKPRSTCMLWNMSYASAE